MNYFNGYNDEYWEDKIYNVVYDIYEMNMNFMVITKESFKHFNYSKPVYVLMGEHTNHLSTLYHCEDVYCIKWNGLKFIDEPLTIYEIYENDNTAIILTVYDCVDYILEEMQFEIPIDNEKYESKQLRSEMPYHFAKTVGTLFKKDILDMIKPTFYYNEDAMYANYLYDYSLCLYAYNLSDRLRLFRLSDRIYSYDFVVQGKNFDIIEIKQ